MPCHWSWRERTAVVWKPPDEGIDLWCQSEQAVLR
jgi:hypothetical protein